MALILQSHGGPDTQKPTTARADISFEALVPADGDIAVDEAADFGYLLPPTDDPATYDDPDSVEALDKLGTLMVPTTNDAEATHDGAMPAVMTYWGQFLDHELTARTDRETELSDIKSPRPKRTGEEIERLLKNARTPRFDLDSVYGGVPVGVFESAEMQRNAAIVSAGLRHPSLVNKMRVGTAIAPGPLPDDTLDPHRDLPRFGQVESRVKDAMLAIARAQMDDEGFAKFEAGLPKRALIGDMRNDENLIVAQFHLSFLRFHNRVVDFLEANDTGWIADFNSAKTLTTLHYQWLVIEGYLKEVCMGPVVDRVLAERARHFFRFRADYAERNATRGLGDALPLEFSTAAFRFGHSMVRNIYDYNRTFGRPTGTAPFDQIFAFTGGGEMGKKLFGIESSALPQNWVIDWSRFVKADTTFGDGGPQQAARAVDTALAPPLADMVNEGDGHDDGTPEGVKLKELFRHLARRNLRRGLSLRLPTGQALHAHLKAIGAVQSDPIADISSMIGDNQALKDFLQGEGTALNDRTPLWFYCLAEAEGTPGGGLGEMGSWLVASTFIGVLLDDPESALSRNFTPDQSPLRMPDGSVIDDIEKWMRFALVLA